MESRINADSELRLQIEMEPANGGRPCGSTEEIQACNVHSCDTYQWRTSDWTPCHLAFDRRCGDGLQTRYVRYNIRPHCKSLHDPITSLHNVKKSINIAVELINLGTEIEQVYTRTRRHGGGRCNLRQGKET